MFYASLLTHQKESAKRNEALPDCANPRRVSEAWKSGADIRLDSACKELRLCSAFLLPPPELPVLAQNSSGSLHCSVHQGRPGAALSTLGLCLEGSAMTTGSTGKHWPHCPSCLCFLRNFQNQWLWGATPPSSHFLLFSLSISISQSLSCRHHWANQAHHSCRLHRKDTPSPAPWQANGPPRTQEHASLIEGAALCCSLRPSDLPACLMSSPPRPLKRNENIRIRRTS